MRPCAFRSAAGFTYLGLMLLIVVLGVSLALAGQVWSTMATREKEKDLLFIGGQFQRAIGAYYESHTGVADRYPKTFDQLLLDPTSPATRRFLRKLYRDPFTRKTEWGMVPSPEGGIMGVFSLAAGTPIKKANFPAQLASFESAHSYADWLFSYSPGQDAVPLTAGVPLQPGGVPTAPSAAQTTPAAEPPKAPPLPREERNCGQFAQADAKACAFEKQRWGDSAECLASAQARSAACQAGQPLPPLFIRFR